MNSPHLLLAGSNCRKVLENLRGILDQANCDLIEQEIGKNTVELFNFGIVHFQFARSTSRTHWRQKVSRFYYAAYNIRRAVQLHVDGIFKTDVSDHKNIDSFPANFPNSATYKVQLITLRDDRNLADYGFDSTESDLIISVSDAEALVSQFSADARNFLIARGLVL